MSAFLIALCASPSYAKHHHDNNPNNTATETTTTVNPNGDVQTTVTTASVGIDYSVLADPDLSYFDIRRAQAYGMTDMQIAQCAKLSHYGMVPMDRVLDQIENGRTMADIAVEYGVSLDNLADASDWQDRVHDYMDAWRHTGYGALRNGPPPASVATYSTNTGQFDNNTIAPVPSGSTITPNGTMVTPNGTTVAPNGTTVEPNGTTTAPNGTMVTPNGTTVAPNGTTVAPNGDTSPGAEAAPGVQTTPDTSGTDNGTTVTPNGATIAPNGTTVGPNGDTTAPNGTMVSPNGTTTAPNGTTVTPNGTTVAPNGTTVAPNGDTSTSP